MGSGPDREGTRSASGHVVLTGGVPLRAGHMIMHGNPAFIEAFGAHAIGQPAREALIGLPPKAFELMDLVFATGKPGACQVTTAAGPRRLVVVPRRDPETGETYGVTTHLRAPTD